MKFKPKVKLDISQVTDRSPSRRRHIGYQRPGTYIDPGKGNAQTGPRNRKQPNPFAGGAGAYSKAAGKKPTDKIKPTPAIKKKKK